MSSCRRCVKCRSLRIRLGELTCPVHLFSARYKLRIYCNSLKSLTVVKFAVDESAKEKAGDEPGICPSCRKSFTNNTKAYGEQGRDWCLKWIQSGLDRDFAGPQLSDRVEMSSGERRVLMSCDVRALR